MEQNPTKKCPKCQKEVDAKASKCPYCQSSIYSWTLGRKVLFFALIPLCAIAIASLANDSSSSPEQRTPEQIAYQKKHDFAGLAKMNVEMMLKAPSTAKFNSSPTIKVDGTTYSIDSWVDSENSFGAMVRSYWSARAHYVGGDTEQEIGKGTNWIVDELIFDGKKIQ